MLCRICLKAGQSLLDRPTSSKIGAKVFSRYLSTVNRSSISQQLPPTNAGLRRWIPRTRWGPRSSPPLRRNIHTETKNEDAISRWTELGISLPLAERLISSYPHIIQPTSAQKLFLLAVGAGKEVYLKDDMGRGKTLALALSAMNIALRSHSNTNTTQNGVKVMIIVPTPHLAQQVHQHLVNLSPTETQESFTLIRFNSNHPSQSFAQTSAKSHSKLDLPDKPIIISTPKDLQSYDLSPSSLPFLRYIFLDEPEHLIGPIPSRHSTSQMLISHPLFRHPPPIVSALNDLLNILPAVPSRRKKEEGGILDYSKRRDEINTIWVSSGMNKDLKRLIKIRGWIRKSNRHVKDGLIDLDFTQGASDKLKDVRNRLLDAVEERITKRSSTQIKENQKLSGIEDEGGVKNANIDGHEQIEPEHHVLVIDAKDGSITSLNLHAPTLQDDPTKEVEDENGEDEVIRKREIPIEMIETLSLIHATTSSSSKGYSLILPPEGISLNLLSEELANLGISSLILTPDLVDISLSQLDELQRQNRDEAEEEDGGLPLLLGTRSSIPGLHLPELQTIYLLDGLDIKGLSKKQRKSGGVKDRYGWYSLVKGRLGRLGSNAIGRERQRVVSLVMGGTEEEMRLRELFGKNENVNGIKLQLKDWDMKGLEDTLGEMMRDEDATAGLEMEEELGSQEMMKFGQDQHGPKGQAILKEEAGQADVRKESM
ncbi:hypothetical protein V865_005873 [Kwoniella europaea PYCC6329]|uniref:Helicase ATP-binding domain-containing protein n=1 Tax=Kwoniella europaea PYCC6329 TaxID=1423913 RepID=A0AAX4KP76_9TREE